MSSDWLVPVLLGAAVLAAPVAAQDAPTVTSPIVSSDISVSRDQAELRLELADGRTVRLALTGDGAVRLNGDRIGGYSRRDALDRSWRELLQEAIDAPAGTLAAVLMGWAPPGEAGGVGRRLSRELDHALRAAGAADPTRVASPATAQEALADRMSDSIARLQRRIIELEQVLEDPGLDPAAAADLPALRDLRRNLEREVRDQVRRELRAEMRASRPPSTTWGRPFRHITRGLAGVLSTLMAYAVLVGLGFLAVFFGRRYLEGIADTARRATLRSGLVGLAGSFLVLPAFILGILALAISIVGIPLLLVFVPLFPVAVVLAALAGYLAVAHGAGEALAERRFTGTDWFARANSYYYVMTGVGLLLVLFIAAHVLTMAGPWLGFLQGLLTFMAVMLTWAAFTVGFGAFLISRGGTRPPGDQPLAADAAFEEETRV